MGVPKTIDNDIAGCERSFGFDTAVATVTEALAIPSAIRLHRTSPNYDQGSLREDLAVEYSLVS